MVMPSLASRQALIAHLRSHHILSVFHYLPLHLSEMGQHYGGQPGDCPITERLGDCLLRLPFYNDLSDADQTRVVEAIHSFDGWA
jgi:dTDP-4-amino-4,6-dideoxygalactose transaminase